MDCTSEAHKDIVFLSVSNLRCRYYYWESRVSALFQYYFKVSYWRTDWELDAGFLFIVQLQTPWPSSISGHFPFKGWWSACWWGRDTQPDTDLLWLTSRTGHLVYVLHPDRRETFSPLHFTKLSDAKRKADTTPDAAVLNNGFCLLFIFTFKCPLKDLSHNALLPKDKAFKGHWYCGGGKTSFFFFLPPITF